MRVLTYKRTHTGDPDSNGVFGVYDCMGRVRDLNYDAVIGVGGVGAEARSHAIDGKITWVGVHPSKRRGTSTANSIVTFQCFVLFDAGGPLLGALAPSLARRIYAGKVRYLLTGYAPNEQAEAEEIVKWALEATSGVVGEVSKVHKGARVKCVCKPRKRGTATRRLTLRSSGRPTACRPGREALWYMLHLAARAPCRRPPLSSTFGGGDAI